MTKWKKAGPAGSFAVFLQYITGYHEIAIKNSEEIPAEFAKTIVIYHKSATFAGGAAV